MTRKSFKVKNQMSSRNRNEEANSDQKESLPESMSNIATESTCCTVGRRRKNRKSSTLQQHQESQQVIPPTLKVNQSLLATKVPAAIAVVDEKNIEESKTSDISRYHRNNSNTNQDSEPNTDLANEIMSRDDLTGTSTSSTKPLSNKCKLISDSSLQASFQGERSNSASNSIGKVGKTVMKRLSNFRPKMNTAKDNGDKHNGLNVNKSLFKQDDPLVIRMYDSIPLLEVTKLPRGGISIATEAVGLVQFGIPPETIKDSMIMGLGVPNYFIVPVERFCRESGPALGVNLAEFEFPAYFNFFIQKRRCTLIVDSEDAERNIRRVFTETLLGPTQFRRKHNPLRFDPEDFASDFNVDAIPDFEKELRHFRVMPNGEELVIETLLDFVHFEKPKKSKATHDMLGVPPQKPTMESSCLESESKENIKDRNDAENGMTKKNKTKNCAYSRIKLCDEVAVIYPSNATQNEIETRKCKRVELFKIQGGEEYVLHDINEDNIIVGKIRFSGSVRVSESMSVTGFGGVDDDLHDSKMEIPKSINPPTFHPPSFGVTVLGNSHGFDKSGSVSGYVLWINGRGVMIDPPPYSSATLEREGIRPRTIVGIILTHCHADHDAGAFQKVLTGSPVVVITTPTIYKSFIRKYAALSNLSPMLLRHSHRHKPAIIGTPLRFQGATFHFTYTLHSIPCVGFRVEWRGRSMVFTGDHFNSPPDIDKLQESGVLSKARADDLRRLPLQDADLLLHEAGVPPLHTPLDVLLKLPKRVKDRLYVVHTQALPPDCELRVAPTGTAGTIRLDEKDIPTQQVHQTKLSSSFTKNKLPIMDQETTFQSMWSSSEYESSFNENNRSSVQRYSIRGANFEPPKVALRPTSTTDAWFVLNLLSAVPFLSGLSYSSTMEVLETARVDAFCINEIVVPASRRKEVLCVVWEGTCMERPKLRNSFNCVIGEDVADEEELEHFCPMTNAVWHAGDWTGPISLQPEKHLSGESNLSETHDVVAMSQQGVKAITIEFASLHRILKNGSLLYRTYLRREKEKQHNKETDEIPDCLQGAINPIVFADAVRRLDILELFEFNSTLRKLSAVQKRHLETLAEGPKYLAPGERLWRQGAQVENAFIVVGGTVSFVAKRRNAGSAAGFDLASEGSSKGSTIGDMMRRDCIRVRDELKGRKRQDRTQEREKKQVITPMDDDDLSIESAFSSDSEGEIEISVEQVGGDIDFGTQSYSQGGSVPSHDYSLMDKNFESLSIGLQKRAENLNLGDSVSSNQSGTSYIESATDDDNDFDNVVGGRIKSKRRRSSTDRNVNRQLHRLYKGRAYTAGLVFSKGHFLGDISKMVAGLLASTYQGKDNAVLYEDDNSVKYGFGDNNEGEYNPLGGRVGEFTIHEQEGDQHIVHSSTLAAGKDGCVVLVFPKPSLILFLDQYPGLLLSLLGTQVVL